MLEQRERQESPPNRLSKSRRHTAALIQVKEFRSNRINGESHKKRTEQFDSIPLYSASKEQRTARPSPSTDDRCADGTMLNGTNLAKPYVHASVLRVATLLLWTELLGRSIEWKWPFKGTACGMLCCCRQKETRATKCVAAVPSCTDRVPSCHIGVGQVSNGHNLKSWTLDRTVVLIMLLFLLDSHRFQVQI